MHTINYRLTDVVLIAVFAVQDLDGTIIIKRIIYFYNHQSHLVDSSYNLFTEYLSRYYSLITAGISRQYTVFYHAIIIVIIRT